MTIYKFPLRITDEQTVPLPTMAKILCIQMQDGIPHIWAMLDPAQPRSTRVIRIIGTGHELSNVESLSYIGSIQQFDGLLIWHVFEER